MRPRHPNRRAPGSAVEGSSNGFGPRLFRSRGARAGRERSLRKLSAIAYAVLSRARSNCLVLSTGTGERARGHRAWPSSPEAPTGKRWRCMEARASPSSSSAGFLLVYFVIFPTSSPAPFKLSATTATHRLDAAPRRRRGHRDRHVHGGRGRPGRKMERRNRVAGRLPGSREARVPARRERRRWAHLPDRPAPRPSRVRHRHDDHLGLLHRQRPHPHERPLDAR